jgi:hypothetical protein
MKQHQLTHLQNMNYILKYHYELHMCLPIDVAASCTSIVLGLGSFPLPACPHNLVYEAVRAITEDILALFYFRFQSDLISVLMHPYFYNFPPK